MLVIRLQRIGKKHQPSYRFVVAEKRSKLGGAPIEDLGSYSVSTKRGAVRKERVLYWLSVGAHPTPTVHNLFVKEGVLEGPKRQIKIRIKKSEEGGAAPLEAVVSDVQAGVESGGAE